MPINLIKSQAMRVFGILFLLIFVPETLVNLQKHTGSFTFEMKQFFGVGSHQTWTEKVKGANLLRIFSSKAASDKRVRRNLIALASVNIIMFGAFMGAMNVMMLYSEVRRIIFSVNSPLTIVVHLRLGQQRKWHLPFYGQLLPHPRHHPGPPPRYTLP